MNKSFCSPGPWRIERKGSIGITIFAADNSEVVSFRLGYNSVRVEANARLMAVAPELLVAAEYAWDMAQLPTQQFVLKYGQGHRRREAWDKLKAAIAKAKGEA